MGAAPAIIAQSRWYPLKKRGTYYGFFSASHNLGEAISFVFVGLVVGLAGWKWGFVGSAIAGAMGVAVILLFLHDTPESKGLPPVEVLSGEAGDETEVERESVGTAQKAAFGNPYIWILALASACMYVSRYAINGWGVIFLQEVKGFRWRRRPRSSPSTPFSASQGRSFRDGCPTNGSTGAVTVSP